MLVIVLLCSGTQAAWGHDQHAHQETAQAKPAESKPKDAVLKVLADYRAAMEARSVEKLANVIDPDLLVLEGVYKNVSWADYRDNHIGPEMKEWKEFRTQDPRVLEVIVHGELAYAVEEATFTIVTADKTVTLAGAETFVLKKDPAGWKIRHLHFSSKKKEPAAKQ